MAKICWIIEKAREFQKNIYFCFVDYIKVFDCVDHNKLWTILKELGTLDYLTCLLRILYAGQEQQLEMDTEQQTSSKSGKEYVKTIYCYTAYLTYMPSESESEVTQSCPTLCDPMNCIRLLRPWDFPGKSAGVDCHFLLQGAFPTQKSNPGLLHCRQTL